MDDENKTDGFRNKLMRSSRAKNQTVMLTPEIAAQVRAAALGDDTPGIEPPPSIEGFERPTMGGARQPVAREPAAGEDGGFGRRDGVREGRREESGSFREPDSHSSQSGGRDANFREAPAAREPGTFQFRGNLNSKQFDSGPFGEEPKGGYAPPHENRAQESKVFQVASDDPYDGWDDDPTPANEYKSEPQKNSQFPNRFEDQFSRPSSIQRPVVASQDFQKESAQIEGEKFGKQAQPEKKLREEKMNPGTVRVVSQGELTKIAGFMISFDVDLNGEVCELRKGRWMLSSRVSSDGGCIVLEDASISQLHAIVRVTNDGKIQVLDQLSEYGTGILRAGSEEEEEVVGAMVNLEHGDRVRFGKRYFFICVLPQID